MTRYMRLVCLCGLSLACAGRVKGAPSSRLLATRCPIATTGQSHAALSLRAQPAPSAPDAALLRLEDGYVRLTVIAIRAGHPDSAIARVADDSLDVPALTPGFYRIEVRALGFQSVADTLRIGSGEWWCITGRLVPPDFLLDPLVQG